MLGRSSCLVSSRRADEGKMQARTIETAYGELPVLDTWRGCRHTETGWTGVNEKGERVNIAYRPEEREFGPARMPPDKDYVVIMRGDPLSGAAEGVVLIERAIRAAWVQWPRK